MRRIRTFAPRARPASWVLLWLACVWLKPAPAIAEIWTTAYYPGWVQNSMAASNVDFTAVTHVIHFAVTPNPDGSLNTAINVISPSNSADVVSRAHQAGCKVLISVGGGATQSAFRSAAGAAHRGALVAGLTSFMTTRGYDGIDLDWEPLDASDAPRFRQLVSELRSALDSISPRPLLTAAVATQPALFASLQGKFDQINLMTYDLAGPYSGWVTWFNSPLFDGGYRFPSTGALAPSIDGVVSDFIAHGIAPAKLAVGIAFFGVVWSGGAGTPTGGVALPRESWTKAPTTISPNYDVIMSTLYQPQAYRWDTNAQAAYLTLNRSGSNKDRFVSYDDERACQAKVCYARDRGLGGVMIWELGGGYRPSQPPGQRDPLLQAVKKARAVPPAAEPQIARRELDPSHRFPAPPAPHETWPGELTANAWRTLTNDLPDFGGPILLNGPIVPIHGRRLFPIEAPSVTDPAR